MHRITPNIPKREIGRQTEEVKVDYLLSTENEVYSSTVEKRGTRTTGWAQPTLSWILSPEKGGIEDTLKRDREVEAREEERFKSNNVRPPYGIDCPDGSPALSREVDHLPPYSRNSSELAWSVGWLICALWTGTFFHWLPLLLAMFRPLDDVFM